MDASILIRGREKQGIVLENVVHLLLRLYEEDIQMIHQLKCEAVRLETRQVRF